MWYLSKCLTVMPTTKKKQIHQYCWYQDAATNSCKSQLSSSGIQTNSSLDKPMKNYINFLIRILKKAYLNILNNQTISQAEWPWDRLKSPWEVAALAPAEFQCLPVDTHRIFSYMQILQVLSCDITLTNSHI